MTGSLVVMLDGCIDVSHWQVPDDLDWKTAVAGGCIAVIVKFSQGASGVDASARRHVENALAAGVPLIGAYHFGDESDPKVQAAHFLALVAGAIPLDRVMLMLDAEQNTPQMTVAGAEAFVQAVQDASGRWPWLYMGRSGPDGTGHGLPSTILANCPLLLPAYGNHAADLGSILPHGWRLPRDGVDRGEPGMGVVRGWQFTDGSTNGGSFLGLGKVDQSKLIGFASLNEVRAVWVGGVPSVAAKPAPAPQPIAPAQGTATAPVADVLRALRTAVQSTPDGAKQLQAAVGATPDGMIGRLTGAAIVKYLAMVGCLILLLSLGHAFAADVVVAAPASTESQVWFGNALTGVLTLCVPTVAAICCGVLWKLAAKFGIQADAAQQANLTAEATTALTQAIASPSTSQMILNLGWDHVDVHNKVIADALNFFLQRFPDRATAIATAAGVSSPALPSPAKDSAIVQTLLARLPDAVLQAAQSPATPPAEISAAARG